MSYFICFDLEGPLSPQDNAYELMKLIPGGERVFEIISRYDDLLTLAGKEGYEPGDTLALIIPFLIYHGLSEVEIKTLAHKAGLVEGSRELISALRSRGWQVFCISTSYEQYARHICQRINIDRENLACTKFPLDRFRGILRREQLAPVKQIEEEISRLRPVEDDERIKEKLDRFFWEELPGTELGEVVGEVKPMGGQRKVEALKEFAARSDCPLDRVVVIGDSITDFKMLREVNESGGLAIAFNANEYALPYATVGLASTTIYDLDPVLRSWEEGGRKAVEEIVKAKEEAGGEGNRGYFHWLLGRKEFDEPLKLHKRIRRLVREEAGELG